VTHLLTIDTGPLVVNHPPVAQCQDVSVSAGAGCLADADVDDGSFDPDGDPITLSQEPAGPYSPGDTGVTLTVEDDRGGVATCEATVTVVDDTAPAPQCNTPASIVPPDAPISFTATAIDNCSASVTVTEFDCYKFTQKGKKVDKTDGCSVVIDGATLTILDAGGVGTHITWDVAATDASGNASALTCHVEVVNPGKGP
jgi:hypothetical protein